MITQQIKVFELEFIKLLAQGNARELNWIRYQNPVFPFPELHSYLTILIYEFEEKQKRISWDESTWKLSYEWIAVYASELIER